MYWHTICANTFLFLYIAKGVPQASRPGGLWIRSVKDSRGLVVYQNGVIVGYPSKVTMGSIRNYLIESERWARIFSRSIGVGTVLEHRLRVSRKCCLGLCHRHIGPGGNDYYHLGGSGNVFVTVTEIACTDSGVVCDIPLG